MIQNYSEIGIIYNNDRLPAIVEGYIMGVTVSTLPKEETENIEQVEEDNPIQERPTVEQVDQTKNEFNNWYKKYIEGKDNISTYTKNWNKDKWYDFFKYVKRKNYDISVISGTDLLNTKIEEYILHKNVI